MRRFVAIIGLLVLCQVAVAQRRQQLPVNQWPKYQYNSNFSPLTQITPGNVAQLTRAWTFNYGAGSLPSGNLGLDYRFETTTSPTAAYRALWDTMAIYYRLHIVHHYDRRLRELSSSRPASRTDVAELADTDSR